MRPGRMFRYVRADEIDARIGVDRRSSGLSLLLYKDARCDMNILDETVGPYNWKRQHSRDNANCMVSIRDPETGEWIGKEDTGVESRTEAEKGLASDSFKRACVNWGIGRELYNAPFIWIANKFLERDEDGKCYMRFAVKKIEYDDNDNVIALDIVNAKTGDLIFSMDKKVNAPVVPDKKVEKPVAKSSDKPVSVSVSDKVKTVDQVVAASKVSEKSLQRNAEWAKMANRFKLTSAELSAKYKQFIEAGVLPAIPLKELSDVQFDAMVRVFNENIHVA